MKTLLLALATTSLLIGGATSFACDCVKKQSLNQQAPNEEYFTIDKIAQTNGKSFHLKPNAAEQKNGVEPMELRSSDWPSPKKMGKADNEMMIIILDDNEKMDAANVKPTSREKMNAANVPTLKVKSASIKPHVLDRDHDGTLETGLIEIDVE